MREGLSRLVDSRTSRSDSARSPGSCPAAGRSWGRRGRSPTGGPGGRTIRVLENFRRRPRRRSSPSVASDTLGVAARIYARAPAPVVGVPKTIDNDLAAIRLHVRVRQRSGARPEAIDRLHRPAAESHNRVMVLRVIGRHTGWITVMAASRGCRRDPRPQQPFDRTRRRARRSSVATVAGRLLDAVVVARVRADVLFELGESRLVAGDARDTDQFGHVVLGGVGDALAQEIESADGVRDARHRARPRATRRHADRARPRARDALRVEGRGARPRGSLRPHGRAPRRRSSMSRSPTRRPS